MDRLGDYFKQKTKNISFIEIKPDTYIDVNGYKVTEEIPLPIVIDDLIKEVKTNKTAEEIKFASFINGIIYTLGVDPEFKYFEDYKEILYKYDEKIEEYIMYMSLNNVNQDNLEIAMIYLRALYFINNDNVTGKYNYSLIVAEKAKQEFESNNLKLGKDFLDASTRLLEETVNDDPNFHLAYYKLGYHYKSRKEYKKSQLTWEKFLTFGKEDELMNEVRECLDTMKDDVIYEEGYTLVLEGYAEEGLEKLLSIEKNYENWWNLLFVIGLGYRQLGEFDRAKEYFTEVLKIEADQVDALNELGLCSVYLGQVDEALAYFTRAIELSPQDVEIMCNRGMTYLQTNDMENAKRDIMKAYEINPEDEITISCVNELERHIN